MNLEVRNIAAGNESCRLSKSAPSGYNIKFWRKYFMPNFGCVEIRKMRVQHEASKRLKNLLQLCLLKVGLLHLIL